MGESRLSRWLAQTKVEGEGEDQWADLVQFLEKELKVCQQKAMIFTKGKDKTNNAQHQQKNSGQRSSPSYLVDHSHNSGNTDDVTAKCSFCGEKGHVAANCPHYPPGIPGVMGFKGKSKGNDHHEMALGGKQTPGARVDKS